MHLLVFCEFVKSNAERLVYSYASGDGQIHMLSVSRKINSDVSLSTLGFVNQLYIVACLLNNFQGPLILHNTARN